MSSEKKHFKCYDQQFLMINGLIFTRLCPDVFRLHVGLFMNQENCRLIGCIGKFIGFVLLSLIKNEMFDNYVM